MSSSGSVYFEEEHNDVLCLRRSANSRREDQATAPPTYDELWETHVAAHANKDMQAEPAVRGLECYTLCTK